MSFETFIACDQEGCNTRRQVEGPGHLPVGWIFIEFIRPGVLVASNGRTQQGNQQGRLLFCSWRCLSKEVKKNLTEKIDG